MRESFHKRTLLDIRASLLEQLPGHEERLTFFVANDTSQMTIPKQRHTYIYVLRMPQ